jgi:ribose/xylose/arabinose/galactoside ABC-type transport system permease subunit
MTISYSEAFPHWDNFAAVLLDTAQNGILTVGMMILLVGGVFDLSVGSTLAFSGIVAGVLVKDIGLPPLIAFLGGILTGSLCGTINGLIITRLRINALITTLAMQGILQSGTAGGLRRRRQPASGFKPFGQTVFWRSSRRFG